MMVTVAAAAITAILRNAESGLLACTFIMSFQILSRHRARATNSVMVGGAAALSTTVRGIETRDSGHL
ncbi:hypothetical protein [Nocardia tengchongensis]|uniref:hypothetical protein n=1 Tax=Nocardia tengchongensis TaxID=2055889 RepID=UPI0036AD4E91